MNQWSGNSPVAESRSGGLKQILSHFSSEWLIAGGIGLTACVSLGCICAVLSALLLRGPVTPVTPVITPSPQNTTTARLVTSIPTLNPAIVGKYVNPYLSAGLQGMSVLQIDVRDAQNGNYVRAAQLTGAMLNPFVEAFNVSVKTMTPLPECIDHVRLTATRADTSVITFGVCLKDVVILRGVPDFAGVDLPMYPGFSDALAPYLPDSYKALIHQ